jgi:nitrogen fixation NifU-like protein
MTGRIDYSPLLLDHFENPRNVGTLADADGVGLAGNPACGDRLEVSLQVRDGRIHEARFRASGCTAAIAGGSMATVKMTGRTLAEAEAITDADVAAALGGLSLARVHCSVLAQEAIRAALHDYRSRRAE